MFAFQLAEHLHKTVAEIMQMNLREFYGWGIYIKHKASKDDGK